MEHKSDFVKKAEKSWLSYFVKNNKVAFLAALIIIVWGGSAAITIPKESAPDIDFGMVVISTFYDGAAAVDMDKLVTQEIENTVKDVQGIDKITSSSRDSFSSIQLQLETDADITKTVADIRSKVDEAKSKLPSDAEDPNILEIDSSMDPIFNVNLTGNIHPALLRDYAENLKSYLEQDSVIQEIDISGGAEREIYVDVDPLKLAQYSISITEVSSAIQNTHRDFPIGNFEIDELDYSLRFQGQHKNAEDISNIVLRLVNSNGQSSPITIGDLANVYEETEEIETIQSFTSLETENHERLPTVLLNVNKSGNTNIFTVDPYIRQKVLDYVENHFGNTVEVHFTSEQLENVRDSYNTVISSGISSILIVFILLMLFIGVKEAIAASFIIPLTFLVTIGYTSSSGGTLNFMVNFSLILALGILVDTSIVIVEGIHEGIKEGYTPKEAAMAAVHEFKAPLISGTLTTLAVFIPLLVLPGILGKYLSYIPISVSVTLVASLIIALLIIPSAAATLLKCKKDRKKSNKSFFGKLSNRFYKFKEKLTIGYQEKYKAFTIRNLKNPTWRFFSIYGIIMICALTFLLPVQFTMFPSDDQDQLSITIKMPEGTVKERTLEATLPVEQILLSNLEVRRFETKINDNQASISVELFKKEEREAQGLRTSIQFANNLREKFKNFSNYEVNVGEISGGPPSDAPVAFRLIAEDSESLQDAQKVATELKEILKEIPETDNVKDDVTNIPGEITYRVNREEAMRLGINPETVAFTTRTAIKGSDAITITREGREVDVKVRYSENKINNFDDIGNLQLINNSGQSISLSQVVTQEFNPAVSEIKRTDRKIAVTISSQLTKDGNAMEVTNAFKEKIKDYEFPDGVTLEDAGENAENTELFIALASGFIMAMFLMFTILVIQFNSFSYPFIILFTIIMSFIGINTGLYITGTPRSLAMIIGTISLAGIVVNDAIILVDRINNLRKKYPERALEEIIAFAGSSRLQPIILTTLTTAAGIAPLIFVDTFWAGLSYTIIFGLSVASTLTLFVTPSMYYQFTLYMYQIIYRMLIALFGVITIVTFIGGKIIGGIILGIITIIIYVMFQKAKKKKIKLETEETESVITHYE